MRFWDSSAVVPLLVYQSATDAIRAEYRADPDIAAWWGTPTECVSAIARLERDGALPATAVLEALHRLDRLVSSWCRVEPVEDVRRIARRLLRTHPLRAADALQLAAALVTAGGEPEAMVILCLDARLTLAAQREGFTVQG